VRPRDSADLLGLERYCNILFLILTSIYTITRPSALVYIIENKKKNKEYYISEDDEDEEREDHLINYN
jgi:hypothetical protein